jgi:lipase
VTSDGRAQPVWLIFPGMTMPVEDFTALADALPGEVRVLDAYSIPLTAPARLLRNWFWRQDARHRPSVELGPWTRVRLVGHSAGGAAALEWLATYPGQVEAVFLLEPTDLHSRPSRLLPGTCGHRAVAGLLWVAGSWPWLARHLGRAGRRAFWRLFSTQPDHLARTTIDRIWGNRTALLPVWHQVFDRFNQERRARRALAMNPKSWRSAAPIWVMLGQKADPYQRGQARRLGATVIKISGGHLFPVEQPAETAAAITAAITAASTGSNTAASTAPSGHNPPP